MNTVLGSAEVLRLLAEAERLCAGREWAAAAVLYDDLAAQAGHILMLAESSGAEGDSALARQLLAGHLDLPLPPATQAAARAALAAIDGKPSAECVECHCVATYTEPFRVVGGRLLCPDCGRRTVQRRGARPWPWLALAIVLIAGVLMSQTVAAPYGFLLVNLALYVLALVPLVFLHELAHGAMALLLGGQILSVQVGAGPKLYERKSARRVWVIRLYPLAGFIVPAFDQERFLRLRHFLTVAIAPLLHLLIAVLLWPSFDLDRLATGPAAIEVIWIANIVLLVSNLLPLRATALGVQVPNDGLQMLNLLTGKTSATDLAVQYFAVRGGLAFEAGQHQDMLRITEAGLQRYPDSMVLRLNHSAGLLLAGSYQEAYAQLEADLPSLEGQPFQLANALNNAACALQHLPHEQDRIARAFDYAQRAFWLAPWFPAVEGTLAAAQIERGPIACGLLHLDSATSRDSEASATMRAARLAWMAIGRFRLGDIVQAQAALAQAQALDPDQPEVRLAEREML